MKDPRLTVKDNKPPMWAFLFWKGFAKILQLWFVPCSQSQSFVCPKEKPLREPLNRPRIRKSPTHRNADIVQDIPRSLDHSRLPRDPILEGLSVQKIPNTCTGRALPSACQFAEVRGRLRVEEATWTPTPPQRRIESLCNHRDNDWWSWNGWVRTPGSSLLGQAA